MHTQRIQTPEDSPCDFGVIAWTLAPAAPALFVARPGLLAK